MAQSRAAIVRGDREMSKDMVLSKGQAQGEIDG